MTDNSIEQAIAVLTTPPEPAVPKVRIVPANPPHPPMSPRERLAARVGFPKEHPDE